MSLTTVADHGAVDTGTWDYLSTTTP